MKKGISGESQRGGRPVLRSADMGKKLILEKVSLPKVTADMKASPTVLQRTPTMKKGKGNKRDAEHEYLYPDTLMWRSIVRRQT